jgi:hypothetical protein
LHSSTAITEFKSRREKRAGYEANTRDIRNAHIIFTEQPKGMRPLGIPDRQWDAKIYLFLLLLTSMTLEFMFSSRAFGVHSVLRVT